MAPEVEELAKSIRAALDGQEAWSRLKTNIPGIFVVKIPDPKGFHASLMFNPPDEEGEPRKRKGLYFDDVGTVRAAKTAFGDEHLEMVVQAVRTANRPETTPVLDVRPPKRTETHTRY